MMKKILIAAVALLCLSGTAAAQRHIEFRWHGVYVVGDMSYAFNLNRSPGDFGIADTVSGFMPMVVGGFQFRKEAGVGVGAAYFNDPDGAFAQLPLFVELRSNFLRSQITPYTAVQVGYSLPVGKSSNPPVKKIEEGGLYVGIEAGARYAVSRSLAVGAHAGYRLLHSNKVIRHDANNIPMLTESATLHMLQFGVSLYFGN
jgi:opacity protein-like surface antigen